MKTFVGLRAVLGLLAALGLALAMTPAAQAYPDVTIEAHVSDTTVRAGATFTASSSANVQCAWTHEFDGTTHRGTGKDFTSRFTAPQVQRRTVIPVEFTCSYASTDGPATARRTINVSVLPANGGNDGGSVEVLAPGVSPQGDRADRDPARGAGASADPAADQARAGAAAPALAGPAAADVDGSAGMMPGTGGPNLLFVLVGLLLLVAGTVAVRRARSRYDGDSDLPRV